MTNDHEMAIPGDIGDSSYRITLPVGPNEFASFIKGLIGGKNKLEEYHNEALVVTPDLLRSLEHALKHRVRMQQGSNVISETYTVQFSNGKSYTEYNIEQILALSPIGDEKVTSFNLRYDFLIEYPDSKSPKREMVEIFISERTTFMRIDIPNLETIPSESFSAKITISYSERTWAEDISNLIRRCLTSAERPDDHIGSPLKILKFLTAGIIQFYGSIAILISYCIFLFRSPFSPAAVRATSAPEEVTLNDLRLVLDQILLQTSPANASAHALFILVTSVLLVVSFLLLCSKITERVSLPYVLFLLYRPDHTNLARLKSKYNSERILSFLAFLLSIAARSC